MYSDAEQNILAKIASKDWSWLASQILEQINKPKDFLIADMLF